MAIDSKAFFGQFVKQIGIDSLLPGMRGHGWETMATFAFSCAYVPGQSSEELFMRDVVLKLVDEGTPMIPSIRRLFF